MKTPIKTKVVEPMFANSQTWDILFGILLNEKPIISKNQVKTNKKYEKRTKNKRSE